MPFVEHPLYKTPHDNEKMWRYISLSQLVSMLMHNALFFSRADKLGEPYEGFIPLGTMAILEAEIEALRQEDGGLSGKEAGELLSTAQKDMRRFTLINCWHLASEESVAMWRGHAGDGVAIQTTVKAFKESLQTDKDLYLGSVDYIDFRELKEPFAPKFKLNSLEIFLLKRKEFSFEKEVRAVISELPDKPPDSRIVDCPDIYGVGVEIPIDMNTLIEQLVVPPKASNSYKAMVEELCRDYGLPIDVRASTLDIPPEW